MKTLLLISVSSLLAATLQATPASGLASTSPTSSGFLNTQIGNNDLANRPAPAPIAVPNGHGGFDYVQTNGSASTSVGGGFGGSTGPFTRPEFGPPIVGANSLGGYGGDGAATNLIAQTNGPAQAVPEPSSSWLLLALAVIPILKLRSSRKTRAS